LSIEGKGGGGVGGAFFAFQNFGIWQLSKIEWSKHYIKM